MTNFSKNSSSPGFLTSFDVPYQVLSLVGTGIAAALAVSAAVSTSPEGYALVASTVPPSLRDAVASAVAAKASTPDLSLHAKAFALQWVGLYLPFGISLLLFHLALPGLHKNVRRLGAFAFAFAFLAVCVGALKSGNRAWGESGVLAAVPLGTPTFYQFLRALLFTVATLGFSVPFIFNAGRDASRALRVLVVVAAFVGWVSWDWRQSRESRTVDEANLADTVRHRFVLVFPATNRDVLLEALSLPESQAMKERLVSLSPVFPVTPSVLPQIATLLSARTPPEHGIRDNDPQPEALERLGELVRAERDSARHVHSTNAGGFDGTAELLQAASDTGHWCSPNIASRSQAGFLENSPLLAALLPSTAMHAFFPASRCTQRFFALEDLLGLELADIGKMLKKPLALDAWFYLCPNNHNGWQGLEDDWDTRGTSEVAQRQLHLHRIARALEVTADQLSAWGLWHNSDVFVVGLGNSEPPLPLPPPAQAVKGEFTAPESPPMDASLRYGVFSHHSTRPPQNRMETAAEKISSLAPPAAAGLTSNTLVSQVELSWMLTSARTKASGEAESRALPALYQERLLAESVHPLAPASHVLDEEGIPRVRADWLRTALARSTRSTLCRYEMERPGGQKSIETVLVSIENGRKPESSRVSLHPLLELETTARLEKDAEGCARAGRESLLASWSNDKDLPDRKWDTMAVLKKEGLGEPPQEDGQ
ncbi:MAG: hypothetical protein IOD12_00030 [Silvanigrellales bacterium]|nr:hypothetical protein [Silvanigrellales bacterium]